MYKIKAEYNDILKTTTEIKPVSHYTDHRFILCRCVSLNLVSNQYVLHVLNTMLLTTPPQPNNKNVYLFTSPFFRVSTSVSLSLSLSLTPIVSMYTMKQHWPNCTLERSLICRHFQYFDVLLTVHYSNDQFCSN